MREFDDLRRQFGLITRVQALDAGVSRRRIDRLLASGEWHAVARGVYRHTVFPVSFEQKALAAVFATGGVASHLTAAVLHGIEGARPGRVEVTVAAGRWAGSTLARVHQARHLGPGDVTRVATIPATSVARTIVDLGDRMPYTRLCTALDLTVTRRACTPDEVRSSLERAELAVGRPGGAALRRALEAWTPGPMPGSVKEMALVRRLLEWGFGAPERQFYVPGVGFVDLAYPPYLVAIEYDSDEWHDTPRARRRDRARVNDLVAAGWHPFIATADDLRPRASRLRRALAAYLPQV